MWAYDGSRRPEFAETPGPGQESVWDYPRPPRVDRCTKTVVVTADGQEIARTERALRLCETASPPTYYIPAEDVVEGMLEPAAGRSLCEWKGAAQYWGLVARPEDEPVGWSYPEPAARYACLADCVAFYPGRVHCTVNGEAVRPQPGHFYGGWVTDELVGPWKGDTGTGHW